MCNHEMRVLQLKTITLIGSIHTAITAMTATVPLSLALVLILALVSASASALLRVRESDSNFCLGPRADLAPDFCKISP